MKGEEEGKDEKDEDRVLDGKTEAVAEGIAVAELEGRALDEDESNSPGQSNISVQ